MSKLVFTGKNDRIEEILYMRFIKTYLGFKSNGSSQNGNTDVLKESKS